MLRHPIFCNTIIHERAVKINKKILKIILQNPDTSYSFSMITTAVSSFLPELRN